MSILARFRPLFPLLGPTPHLCHVLKITQPKRNFWEWLNNVFNSYDSDRVAAVGPDQACVEWLIRCGAFPRLVGQSSLQKSYDTIPQSTNIRVEEIVGDYSGITALGFRHLDGLKELKAVRLHNCPYVGDEVLSSLAYAESTLRTLELTSCAYVTDKGLQSLVLLRGLQQLNLADLEGVKGKNKAFEHLSRHLPRTCHLKFKDGDFHRESGKPK